ncbi:MAG: GNAT family N-acetyltransferase [Thermoleophilaceae bacterium]
MPSPARARQIALDELKSSDLEGWAALAADAAEPNPFFEPEFVLAAARHLGEHDVSLLVVQDAEHWLACLPVQTTRIARMMPGLRTWNHLYCFLGTPLLHPLDPAAAARSLLALAVGSGRLLALEGLGDGGPACEAVRHAAGALGLTAVTEAVHERALLKRRPDGDYLAALRSHRRRELNRLGRRLEAELGAELSVTDLCDDPSSVDSFLELERSGWKGRGDTALGSRGEHAKFFRSVCESFARDGRLQMLALSAGERTVAMKCNVYAGNGGFCFKIAYDEELGRFSPGVQLERENITRFHENRPEAWQDSCADPENDMINRLWPDRRRIFTTVLARPGARAAVSRQGLKAAQVIRDMERKRSSPTS